MQTAMAYGLEGRTCREPARQSHVKSCPVGTFAGAPPGYEDILAPRPLQGPAVSPGHHYVHVSLDRIAGMGLPLHSAVDHHLIRLLVGFDPEDPHPAIQGRPLDYLKARP